MDKEYSPVVVFAYSRADKIEKCLECLEKCPEAAYTDLFIFCDGPKGEKDRSKVTAVQSFCKEYEGRSRFKKVDVRLSEVNRGLAESIISGVTEVVNEYGRVIVIEDDLAAFPTMLSFLNEGLNMYADEKKCGSVSAYTYPMKCLKDYEDTVFFTRKAECWGWATWADRWDNASWKNTDFTKYLNNRKERLRFESLEAGLDRLMYLQHKGKIDSWAIRWVYYLYQKELLTAYPTRSRILNEGADGSGTHFSGSGGIRLNSADPADSSSADTKWTECKLNDYLAARYAAYPRKFLPLYLFDTVHFLLKK